ncbi:MAG: 2Fe-2S iron-sulfur cluster-binding protein [Pseudomonadota bacterium]
MVAVTFVEASGERHEVDAQSGDSLMQAAVSNGIPGIDAECGGACACATCHVFIDNPWKDAIASPDDMERDMLDYVAEPRATSRLSCQITVGESLEGATVHLPESQS